MGDVVVFEANKRTIMRLGRRELELVAQHAEWEYKITAGGQFQLQLPELREQWEQGWYED